MKMPDKFPVVIPAGGSVVKIYPAKVRHPDKKGMEGESYDSFLVTYYEGGKRVQIRRTPFDVAYAKAKEIADTIREADYDSIHLSGRDRRIFLAAQERLAPLKMDLDTAIQAFVDTHNILQPYGLTVRKGGETLVSILSRLGTASLEEAISFYERHGREVTVRKLIADVIQELLDSVRKDGGGDYHIRDLARRLGRFSQSFSGYIDDVKEKPIRDWLQNLCKMKNGVEVSNEPVLATTRNNYRDALFELFRFAKSQGYLPKLLPHVMENIPRVKEKRGKNHIIAPEDMVQWIDRAPAHLVAPLVIKAFAGLRTEEVFEIPWEAVKFDQDCIVIDADISKLGQRRAVPISENLRRWLKPFEGLKGRICSRWSSPNKLAQAWTRVARQANVQAHKNSLRNSYISYRVALPTSCAIVAQECGNSVRMIEQEYKELATPMEGRAWFDISPKQAKRREITEYVKRLAPEA